MKKKTVKKLALSKETLRGLTDNLRQVAGATLATGEGCAPSVVFCYPTAGEFTCVASEAYHHCDMPETAHPTCVA